MKANVPAGLRPYVVDLYRGGQNVAHSATMLARDARSAGNSAAEQYRKNHNLASSVALFSSVRHGAQ